MLFTHIVCLFDFDDSLLLFFNSVRKIPCHLDHYWWMQHHGHGHGECEYWIRDASSKMRYDHVNNGARTAEFHIFLGHCRQFAFLGIYGGYMGTTESYADIVIGRICIRLYISLFNITDNDDIFSIRCGPIVSVQCSCNRISSLSYQTRRKTGSQCDSAFELCYIQ